MMPTLLKIGEAVRETVNLRDYIGDGRNTFNVSDSANLEPGAGANKPQQGANDSKAASDGAETLSKRSAKTKQEREKGFKPSQYKTRICRRWNEMTPGKCDKGETCWFAHGEDDLSTVEKPIHVPSCVFKQLEGSDIKIILDASDACDSSVDDDHSLQSHKQTSSDASLSAPSSPSCEPCSEMNVPRTVRQNYALSPERQLSMTSSIESEPYTPISPPLPPLNAASFASIPSPAPFTRASYARAATPGQLGGSVSPPPTPRAPPLRFTPSPAEATSPSVPYPRPPPATAWNVARRALFPEATPRAAPFVKQAWPLSNADCPAAMPLPYGLQRTGGDPAERKLPSWPCRVPIATSPMRSKFDTMWDMPTKAEVEPTDIELSPSGCGAQIDRAWAWDGCKLFANPNLPIDSAPFRLEIELEAAWLAAPLEPLQYQEPQQDLQELLRQQCFRDLCEAQLRHSQLCNLFAALQ